MRGDSETTNVNPEASLVVATYNVHRFIGRDRVCDPSRTARVVKELGADVVALQEVVFSGSRAEPGTPCDAGELLPGLSGFHLIPGAIRVRDGVPFGNALVTRVAPDAVRRVDLTVTKRPGRFAARGREVRGALDVDLALPGGPVRIVNAHLGLLRRERRQQFERLIGWLAAGSEDPSRTAPAVLAVLGDFNEWNRLAPWLRTFERTFGPTTPLASFPTWRPLFALDRIWVRPHELLSDLRVHRSAWAARASDHYPVVARIGRSAG